MQWIIVPASGETKLQFSTSQLCNFQRLPHKNHNSILYWIHTKWQLGHILYNDQRSCGSTGYTALIITSAITLGNVCILKTVPSSKPIAYSTQHSSLWGRFRGPWYCRHPGIPDGKADKPHDMMTSLNGNIFRVTGHLCGEFTGQRWIPRTNGQWRGALMFSLICVWIKGWVSIHSDVIVMKS